MIQPIAAKKPNNIIDYGVEFQQQLIGEIITNKAFGSEIIDIIEPEYFRNQYFSYIIKILKEYYKTYELILNYAGIQIEIDTTYGGLPDQHQMLSDTLRDIQNAPFNNENVTKIALQYCKFQKVVNTVDNIQKKLKTKGFEDYNEIEEDIKNAIAFKDRDESCDFYTNIEAALADDYRDPVPTGILGLDEIMNGGLGISELAVIIAPLGVGKTTILSLINSNAYLSGKNTLHIFFEDNMKEVKRKYISHWTDTALEDLQKHREVILRKISEIQNNGKVGKLIFLKLRPENVTINMLRKYIKREKSKLNGQLDLVIIDYADCIMGDLQYGQEEWQGEGKIMRSLESMADEFGVAMWTAVQGGRRSTTADVVQVDMIGGNIKKAQVAHFIMSIAKTLPQRENHTATIAILKSRFGGDGRVFENCTFDNSRMKIDTVIGQSLDSYSIQQGELISAKITEEAHKYRRNHNEAQQNNEREQG